MFYITAELLFFRSVKIELCDVGKIPPSLLFSIYSSHLSLWNSFVLDDVASRERERGCCIKVLCLYFVGKYVHFKLL